MKTVILSVVLALLVVTAAGAVTTTSCTIYLYNQMNQVCAPLVPLDPSPIYEGPSGIAGVFAGWTDLYMGSDWVKKWDPTAGSEKMLLAEWGSDEGVLAGDGYMGWVQADDPSAEPTKEFSFDGVDISDTDLWISLPGVIGGEGGGVHWVGITYPWGTVIDYTTVVVTDGTDAWTMYDIATGAGPQDWMDPTFGYFEPTAQADRPVPWEWDPVLYGGQMYRVTTYKNNLALIIPHP